MAKHARPLRVAVIGTGLAGLSAAHLVDREASRLGVECEVTLLERASCLGFHSSSIVVPPDAKGKTFASDREDDRSDSYDDDGIHAGDLKPKPWILDVPMRSFQGGYYPHLLALYQSLFIPILPKQFTYSFSHLALPSSTTTTHLTYEGNNGLAAPSLPRDVPLWTSIKRLVTYAVCYVWLLVLALSWRVCGWPGGTVKEWTRNVGRGVWSGWVGGKWEEFVSEVVVVLFGAVSTCSDQEVGGLDVGLILGYIWATLGTSHYTAPSSSSSISRALSASIPSSRIHLNATITSLRRDLASSTTSITLSTTKEGQASFETLDGFDEVIFATQANQAKRLLDTMLDGLDTQTEEAEELAEVCEALGEFRYVKTIVINHTDSSILPSPAGDIREINLLRCPSPHPSTPTPTSTTSTTSPSPSPQPRSVTSSDPSSSSRLDYFPPRHDETYTQSTHILYPPPSHAKSHGPVYQTTNPIVPIDPAQILSVAHLERALPTSSSSALLPRLKPSHPSTLQGRCGVWLVGSYAWEGIPLLEGCVRSAEGVAEGILARRRKGSGGR